MSQLKWCVSVSEDDILSYMQQTVQILVILWDISPGSLLSAKVQGSLVPVYSYTEWKGINFGDIWPTDMVHLVEYNDMMIYSKTCFKRPLKKEDKK